MSRDQVTIVPGDPWTINDRPSTAVTPEEALAEVYAAAESFPITITVLNGDAVITLEMTADGSTHDVDPDLEPDPDPELEEAVDITELMDSEEAAEEQDREPAPAAVTPAVASRKRNKKWMLIPAIGFVALAGLGTAAYAFAQGQDQGEEPAAEPTSWTLEEGQRPLGFAGEVLVTLADNQLRIYHADTGEQAGDPRTVEDPEEVRFMEGQNASAIDDGSGEVTFIASDGSTRTAEGTLNARGTEPVAVTSNEYTTADGQSDSIPKDQAVLAATTEGVVFAQAPNQTSVQDQDVSLHSPEKGARITEWVQATEDQAVVIWTKDDTDFLTTHDPETGQSIDQQKVNANDVTIQHGVVWDGLDRYLQDRKLTELCTDGEQITGQVMCPTGQGWKSADGQLTAAEKPLAISETYLVTSDHRVEPTKEK
ncbi:hypothetical protein NBM05_03850 [Rothia sp. AR01]|uniref:Uncharacterized protein n=1 Tax=Rothia santali TaxID=2949643 RepID=A0A9X2H9K5_9MICC|nr:hypothetical protein [Rothia santali]MCP3425181.1 hypothetical protein [Rothia santali]